MILVTVNRVSTVRKTEVALVARTPRAVLWMEEKLPINLTATWSPVFVLMLVTKTAIV
jgi:hypothetical protein